MQISKEKLEIDLTLVLAPLKIKSGRVWKIIIMYSTAEVKGKMNWIVYKMLMSIVTLEEWG